MPKDKNSEMTDNGLTEKWEKIELLHIRNFGETRAIWQKTLSHKSDWAPGYGPSLAPAKKPGI